MDFRAPPEAIIEKANSLSPVVPRRLRGVASSIGRRSSTGAARDGHAKAPKRLLDGAVGHDSSSFCAGVRNPSVSFATLALDNKQKTLAVLFPSPSPNQEGEESKRPRSLGRCSDSPIVFYSES